jgi:hypothetical protein
MNKEIRVAVLYLIIQELRRPIFDRLHTHPDLSPTLYHGSDFEKTKSSAVKAFATSS